MPYNTKKIITDVTGRNPIPAYFNPDTDQYEPLFGQNGSNRVLIWGANDQPLLTQDNPGHVQLTGSNVEVEVEKIINAEVVEEKRNFLIDTADVDECNLWVSSDQKYSIQIYPRTDLGDYPYPEELVSDEEATSVGRQRRHKIGKEFFPAHSILCLFLNRGTEPATVSIYIAISKRV